MKRKVNSSILPFPSFFELGVPSFLRKTCGERSHANIRTRDFPLDPKLIFPVSSLFSSRRFLLR